MVTSRTAGRAPRSRFARGFPAIAALFVSNVLCAVLAAGAAWPADDRAVNAVTAASAPAHKGFDGLWSTSYGRMRLNAVGSEVHGTYQWSGTAHIRGKLDETGAFSFNYDQPDGEKGAGVFKLDADGQNFTGTWKTETGGGGQWRGERVKPEPGRAWLIVLEANWESSLADPEYSYGQMLRSFFTRLPNVQVRHRFVHNFADFRRWSAEAAYFAEPVVLYISSHGSAEGVNFGPDVVGADQIIDCLRDVGKLRLLHFGSCGVMSGNVPQRIAAARAPDERFPISGFTKTADWAGSAIVDFTYLELVLGRDLPPAKAAKQTLKLVKFAGEDTRTVIPGSGLKIYEPGEQAAAETNGL